MNALIFHFVFVFQLLSARMPNVAGRGERLSSDLTYGSKNAMGWSLSFNKPIFANPNHKYVFYSNQTIICPTAHTIT